MNSASIDSRLLGFWTTASGPLGYLPGRDWFEIREDGVHDWITIPDFDWPLRTRFLLRPVPGRSEVLTFERAKGRRPETTGFEVRIEWVGLERFRFTNPFATWEFERASGCSDSRELLRQLWSDYHLSRDRLPVFAPRLLATAFSPASEECTAFLRVAQGTDIPALEQLIPVSARKLQAPYYAAAQIEAALGPVFAVDRELIADGTYFVITRAAGGEIVAAGGWSKRKSLFGGDRGGPGREAGELDPRTDAARIRAFFVHPDHARRGHGRALLHACELMAQVAGFRRAELCATLAGEPLYAKFGYTATRRYEVPLPGGLSLPVVAMERTIAR